MNDNYSTESRLRRKGTDHRRPKAKPIRRAVSVLPAGGTGHCSNVPSFHYSMPASWPIAQNKANFKRTEPTPTAGQRDGYGREHGWCLPENKPNWHRPHPPTGSRPAAFQCSSVPPFRSQALHGGRYTGGGLSMRNKPNSLCIRRAKQSQFARLGSGWRAESLTEQGHRHRLMPAVIGHLERVPPPGEGYRRQHHQPWWRLYQISMAWERTTS